MRYAIALCLAVWTLGCDSEQSPVPSDPVEASIESEPLSAELPVLMAVPEFTLTDQTGEAFGSRDLLGKSWIANFIFTRCQATCPIQTARLVELQDELSGSASWQDVRFVSISVDPEHDTPEVLREYAVETNADRNHWKFLTGSPESIGALVKDGFNLPVAEERGANGAPLTHSPKFVLVDPQGHVRGFYGSDSDEELERLQRDLEITLGEQMAFIDDLHEPVWMESRRLRQLAAAERLEVRHAFSFTDRLPESGIRFRHRIVDDAGRNHKPCHYDHGNGVAVADVDGDGLLDVYFVNQVGGNELWRNRGDGTFENFTETAGVAVKDRIGVAASFADVDNDGDADLYVTNVRSPNVLFENDGTGRFTDVSASSGLDYNGHSSAAVFFDFNRDGLLDLFLVNVGQYTTHEMASVAHDRFTGPDRSDYSYYTAYLDAFAGHLKPERSEPSLLFENQGNNRFVDVSESTGLPDSSWSGDASPLDVNQDGWPDLYVLNMQGHDSYYENVNGERFVDKSRTLFPATPWGAMGIKVFDFDNDGRMDIYITDMHTDMARLVPPQEEKAKIPDGSIAPEMLATDGNHVMGNAFFHSQADGTFREISDAIGAENYWPWGLSVGDLNADGFDDVFIASSMNFPFRYGVNSVLLNDNGRRFVDAEFLLGVEPRRNGRTAVPWFELDATTPDNRLAKAFRSQGGRTQRMVAWGAIGTRSSVIFDIENDGDLDIITNDFNTEPMVLVSDLTEQSEAVTYLKVHLEGTQSNRDGLGANVAVHTPSGAYTKTYDGRSGYLSQSRSPLYFGLGSDDSVERIEVQWPSGRSQVVAGPVAVNTLIKVKEADE